MPWDLELNRAGQSLIDDAKCYQTVRHLSWLKVLGVPTVFRNAFVSKVDEQPLRQRYQCKNCHLRFDDSPRQFWLVIINLYRLDVVSVLDGIKPASNQQIAAELDLWDDVQQMSDQLREALSRSPR